jgi:hypothetical protein
MPPVALSGILCVRRSRLARGSIQKAQRLLATGGHGRRSGERISRATGARFFTVVVIIGLPLCYVFASTVLYRQHRRMDELREEVARLCKNDGDRLVD